MCSFNLQKVPRRPFLLLERDPEATERKQVTWGVPYKQKTTGLPQTWPWSTSWGCPSIIRILQTCKVSQFQRHSGFGFCSLDLQLNNSDTLVSAIKAHPLEPILLETGSKVGGQRSRLWLSTAHSAKDRKLGKRTLALFSRNNGKSPRTNLQEKHGSFRSTCLPPALLLLWHHRTGWLNPDSPNPRESAKFPGIPKCQRTEGPKKPTQSSPGSGLQRAQALLPPLPPVSFPDVILIPPSYRIIKNSFDFEIHFGKQQKVWGVTNYLTYHFPQE